MHAMTLYFSVLVTSQIQAWRAKLVFVRTLLSKDIIERHNFFQVELKKNSALVSMSYC